MTIIRLPNVNRLDPNRIEIKNKNGRHAILFANDDVYIDSASINEVTSFLDMLDYIETTKGKMPYDTDPSVDGVILTPDFHRGAGIPVGTVFQSNGFLLPKATGTDIGCGMRLLTTNLVEREITQAKNLEASLREHFFEGKRGIALSRNERVEIFRSGLKALRAHRDAYYDGVMPTNSVISDFLSSSAKDDNEKTFDAILGTIGGGNHFVELQVVDEIVDDSQAWALGLKKGSVVIMCHSGSLGVGHYIGNRHQDKAKAIWNTKMKAPPDNYYPLMGQYARDYYEDMKAGVNFAFANRYFLGQTAVKALSHSLNKDVEWEVVQDAPHNAIWSKGEDKWLHRKGATPTDGEYLEKYHPVIVPGSMGDSSWVLSGTGETHSYCSACHGAGRIARRGESRKANIEEINKLRVVTPWDHNSPSAKARPDILKIHQEKLMEEAPSAYKSVEPAMYTCRDANIATPVARLRPLLTVKG